MSNPSKRKGSDAEIKLLAWLKENGHPEAVRNPPMGSKDVGDLRCLTDTATWPVDRPIVIEVKSWKDVAAALREGLAELEAEKANAGTTAGVLVLKRRGVTDPGRWFAVREVRDDPEIGS